MNWEQYHEKQTEVLEAGKTHSSRFTLLMQRWGALAYKFNLLIPYLGYVPQPMRDGFVEWGLQYTKLMEELGENMQDVSRDLLLCIELMQEQAELFREYLRDNE